MSNDIAILQSKQISLNAELSNLQSEIQMLNEKKQRLNKAKIKLTTKIQEFQGHQRAFNKLHIENNKWRGQLERKFNNIYYEQMVPELNKYVQKIHVTRDELENSIRGLNSRINAKQSEVSSTKRGIANLKSEITIKKKKEADEK
ncbi:Uncharacterised protein [Listeria grayi]|uniref:Uncharacterized protein n=1 Tax=Listeria grayi TaxID=1641 RepID=A0A378MER7_LISGR|nr:DUF5082 family protein [Listeria grayi]STY44850.1 Uncharacterised protein [Listeria grayi]VEI30631.1 Uncharacterised protein [Listeria grayi]